MDALDVLETLTSKDTLKGKVAFTSVNMDNFEKARDLFISKWPNLTHLFVTLDVKNTIVHQEFGLKFLPHAVLIDQNGIVLKNGGNFPTDKATMTAAIVKLVNSPPQQL
eukprot:TRINITY_DN1754_c0_g2_i1.p1 TRINITY_DN1754_c0_g2~~TRINITY_DN1754_c0_g2_i1.p1  ORF type:complete len:109 (-),score=14.70 TRINITY_DN1754_c0_g2_i1:185-511(-)